MSTLKTTVHNDSDSPLLSVLLLKITGTLQIKSKYDKFFMLDTPCREGYRGRDCISCSSSKQQHSNRSAGSTVVLWARWLLLWVSCPPLHHLPLSLSLSPSSLSACHRILQPSNTWHRHDEGSTLHGNAMHCHARYSAGL